MSALEIVAVAVTVLGIWLTTRRAMLCWPVNLLACALYFEVFRGARLYADMTLQALFGAGILYGWIAWSRGRAADGEVTVMPLPAAHALRDLAAGALGAGAIGWFTSRHTDAALPWMDAALSSFSLVGQYWAARRHAASWWLWIVLDAIYVALFLFKGLIPTAALYAALVGLAIAGLRRWRAAERRAPGPAAPGRRLSP